MTSKDTKLKVTLKPVWWIDDPFSTQLHDLVHFGMLEMANKSLLTSLMPAAPGSSFTE